MVLIVVADIEGDFVERAVVAISFLGRSHQVVFLYPAGSQGM